MDTTYKSFGNWMLEKKLGSGAFGCVFLWTNPKSKLQIATKSLKKCDTLGQDEEFKLKQRWQQEFELLQNLNIDYIVRAVKLEDENFLKYLNDNHDWRPLPVLVMEYCNSGDLRSYLNRMENLNGMTEYEIRKVLHSLRCAIDYIHNKCNIKHRDLKPDNIVIHQLPGGERVYKLTDFGFARFINEQTMLQSVVGTRNYFAPEVIDTSKYTKTVDYWSIGVIAFEMLCGFLPFLPHQSLVNIIRSIKKKSSTCIAITESFTNPNEFQYHDRIFDENRVTTIFRTKMESWLRLTLDVNYSTRGTRLAGPLEIPNAQFGRVTKFYTELDEILKTCVLTTFNLMTSTFHDFEIKPDTTIPALLEEISTVMNIPIQQLHAILPIGHPLKNLTNIKAAKDLYVEQWLDANKLCNPPVMIYLIDREDKMDISKIPEPVISPVIKHSLRSEKQPVWLYQKIAFDIHYLLSKEQHNLRAMLYGIREFAMNIEQEIFEFNMKIESFKHYANIIGGRVLQYEFMVKEAKNQCKRLEMPLSWCDNFFTKWEKSVSTFREKIDASTNKIIPSLLTRSNSALRRMKKESTSEFYEELVKKDVYELKHYCQHLQAQHQGLSFEVLNKSIDSCKYCSKAVYDFIENRSKTLETIQSRSLRTISEINKEHRLIMDTSLKTNSMLNKINTDIEAQTSVFNTEFIHSLLSNAERSTKLVADGSRLPASTTSPNELSLASLSSSISDIMDISTRDLIREASHNMELMSLNCDVNQNDIPRTVNFL